MIGVLQRINLKWINFVCLIVYIGSLVKQEEGKRQKSKMSKIKCKKINWWNEHWIRITGLKYFKFRHTFDKGIFLNRVFTFINNSNNTKYILEYSNLFQHLTDCRNNVFSCEFAVILIQISTISICHSRIIKWENCNVDSYKVIDICSP